MDKDTTTFGVVKGSDYVTTTADEDSNTVKVDVSNKVKDAVTTVEEKGLTFAGETGSTNVQKLGSTVNVTGDDYIDTSAAENTITVTASDKTKKAVDTVEKGLTITSSASTGENKGITTDNLKLDETFNYDAGDNIALTQSDNGLSIATKKDVTFTTVNATTVNGDTVNSKVVNVTNNGGTTTIDGNHITTNNVTINGDVTNETDATTKKYVDDGRTTVTSSDESISVVDNNTDEKINNYDIKVDYNKVAENTDLTYKDNGGADKTVKLKKGLDFVNTTNITMETLADGVVKASLNSALTSITSISNGNTTITLGDTTNTVNVGGAKITNVTNGVDNNDAVNVSQLKAAKTEVKAGNNVKVDTSTATDGHTVYTVSTDLSKLGSMSSFNVANKDETVKSNITDSETVKFTNDGNLTTTVTDEANGSTVTYGLANNVNVGGKDGKDGSVGVKGANGKDGVTITATGADGQDGVDGHIGINGKDGASADMHVKNGSNGVDGTDGKNGTNGMDRIVYEDHNHVTHEVATMDDGLKFTGNNTATENVHKLNTTVKVQGEGTQAGADKTKVYKADGTEFESATGNIAVVADGTDTLTVKLNKDLKNLNSVTATTINGDTINANNMYVTNAPTTNTSVVNKQYADNMGWNIGYDESENDIKNVGKVVNNNTVNFKGIEGTAVKVKTDDAGTNATVDQGKNADGSLNHDYTVNAYDTKVTTSDSNITLTGGELDSSNNVRTYDIALGNDIQIGKDGKNGTIGVNGSDGKSGVGIDGKDGIIVYGKDGKDGTNAVSINGKDGVGHIGLTGGNGKDGVDGSSADISVRNGKNGVDGTDGNNGKNGMDRIVYEDHNHVTHEVATMDDGQIYGGDAEAANLTNGKSATGKEIKKKLNEQVNVIGGVSDETKLTKEDNLGVVSDGTNNLKVRLAKDLKLGKDGSVTIGDTIIKSGDIKVGDTHIEGDKITAKNMYVTNVDNKPNSVTNKKYVDEGRTKVTSSDSSILVDHNKTTNTYDIKVDGESIVANAKLTYKANGGNDQSVKLKDGLNFTNGDNDNIKASVGADGKVKHDLNKDLKNMTSVETVDGNGNKNTMNAAGNTIVNVDGSKTEITAGSTTYTSKEGDKTIIDGKGVHMGDVSVTKNGLDNGNKQIINQASGATEIKQNGTRVYNKDTNGANIGDVKYLAGDIVNNEIKTLKTDAFGVKDTDGNAIKKNLGDQVDIVGKGTKANSEYDASNIKTFVEDGKLVVGLDKNIKADSVTVGEKGKDGKPGKDGYIGVDGKDGSSVAINGKDGSIGLTGPKGADGKDGASANISVKNGTKGLDGNDGKNGESKTRIEYVKPNGEKEEIATLNDGLNFKGNNEVVNKQKLNSTVTIAGEGVDKAASEKFESAAGNVNVKADGKGKLEVQLAKKLKNLESAEFKQGNKSTTINGGSMTINNGAQSTTISSVAGKDANGKTINAVSVNGSQIKHVANGVEDHDAVNVSQLRSGLADVHNHVNKVDKQLRAGVAGANAAAGLPQAYMPGKSMVAASAGAYRGESALAVGYSRASDNGKLVLKLQGNTNSRGDVGGSVGVGYQW
ncbi:collagen-binding protein [Pasteurella bettyae]|uniref:YadA-like C-terminal domain protein n=1 Tax=Pasteurella bettyae CCUG 2042 TaxID=1095749 RepID=I3DEK7_9PAST|nr:collagen-binding protein [Pasteurella bettyae]EIJ70150.1 YadA-like C-terminal domain protein [Pasteurella bettyae CCUG 2042]SUB21914.1 autotransporter adhesin [Pasteurella bettyae]